MSTQASRPMGSPTGPVDDVSAHEKADTASLGDIVGDISAGLSTLLRQEVALAKAEARESASQAGKAAGLFSGAALGGWMAVLFLSLAVWEWISGAIDNRGWAAIIVMAIWAVIAAATRYSSLSGLLACAATPAILWSLGQATEAKLFFVLALLVFVMHRANIARLLAGTESKIGQSAVKP